MFRVMTLVGLLAACATSAVAQKDEKLTTYKTPQEVFDAVFTATQKRDARTLIGCFTPEMQRQMAAESAAQGLFFRDQAEGKLIKDKDKDKKNDKLVKQYQPLFDVLDKHKLDAKATKDLNVKPWTKLTDQQRETILKLIENPAAFAVDWLVAYDKVEPPRPLPRMKLADVKIEGDKASGTVVTVASKKEKDKELTKEEKVPVTFRKIDGSWRIEPPPETREAPAKDKAKDDKKEK